MKMVVFLLPPSPGPARNREKQQMMKEKMGIAK